MERERSAAAAMLGLPGFVVLAVSEQDGELEQAVETTADLVGCPECGAVARSCMTDARVGSRTCPVGARISVRVMRPCRYSWRRPPTRSRRWILWISVGAR